MNNENRRDVFALQEGWGSRLSAWIVQHPILSVLLVFILALPSTYGAQYIVSDFTHRGFFKASDPKLIAVEDLERRFGNDDSVVLVVHHPDGIFNRRAVELVQELTAEMWQVPEVIRVQSLSNYRWVSAEGDDITVEAFLPEDLPLSEEFLTARRQDALTHEVLPRFLISEDAQTTAIFGYIKPGIDAAPDMPTIVSAVEAMVARAEEREGSFEFHITGRAAVNTSFKRSMQEDMKALLPMVFGLTVLFLIFCFRRVSGVVLPVVIFSTGILVAMGLQGWLGLKMTNTTSIVPQILIAIGVADAVHLLYAHYSALRAGLERREAAKYALTKNFRPTLLTSISTAIGFASYIYSDILALMSLGVVATLGTLVVWILTYFLLGPLLVLLPIRGGKARVSDESEKSIVSRRAEIFTRWLDRQRVALVMVLSVLILGAGWLAAGNTVNSDPYGYFKKGFPIRVANDFVEANLGGIGGLEIVVQAGEQDGAKDPEFLQRVDAFQSWINEIPSVTKTVSIIDVLKQTRRALNGNQDEFYALAENRQEIAQQLFLYMLSLPQGLDVNDRITVSNDAIRLSVLWTIRSSEEAEQTAARIKTKADEMGLATINTGKMMLYQSMNGYVVRSFLFSISIAMVLIGILMAFTLRSWRLGGIAMVTNVAPLILGGALIRLTGQPLDIGTVIVASVCLGIAVDDTIHFLAEFKRWREKGASSLEAVARVLTHKAPALIITTVILVASFGVFAFATFTPNRNFGIFTAAILGTALVVDLTLLPALLLNLYRKNDPQTATETETALKEDRPLQLA